jgi:proton-coupled amino acid transporter
MTSLNKLSQALFGGAGILSYAAYGSDVQTVVIKNLPQDSKFVQGVQFLYSLAILLSAPLQIFPALRIMENWLFIQSGKEDVRVKWQKNFFRMCIVIATYFVSWFGAQDLDKFVSFVGSFAWYAFYPSSDPLHETNAHVLVCLCASSILRCFISKLSQEPHGNG